MLCLESIVLYYVLIFSINVVMPQKMLKVISLFGTFFCN